MYPQSGHDSPVSALIRSAFRLARIIDASTPALLSSTHTTFTSLISTPPAALFKIRLPLIPLIKAHVD
jgi:hypothetical protein